MLTVFQFIYFYSKAALQITNLRSHIVRIICVFYFFEMYVRILVYSVFAYAFAEYLNVLIQWWRGVHNVTLADDARGVLVGRKCRRGSVSADAASRHASLSKMSMSLPISLLAVNSSLWYDTRGPITLEKKLSYRKQIARKLRTQYVESIYSNSVTLKSRLKVTQGHWNWYRSKAWVRFPIHLP